MPVYMNSGKIVAGRDGWTGGESKVLQEVLADLKTPTQHAYKHQDKYIHNHQAKYPIADITNK